MNSIDERYIFKLPSSKLKVRPVLSMSTAVEEKQYVLLFEVNGETPLRTEDSLTWSKTLKSLYRYAPATGSAEIIRMAPLQLPATATQLTIQVHTRQPGTHPVAIQTIVMETDINTIATVIYAEGR